MTIYNIGSKYYLGNAKYSSANLAYPSIEYLQGHPHNSISAEISALCTSAGLPFRNVLPQSDFNSYSINKSLLAFGSTGDIDDRYTFEVWQWTSGGNSTSSNARNVNLYNNSGYSSTTNAVSATNKLFRISPSDGDVALGLGFDTTNIGSTATEIQWLGCADSDGLALVAYQHLLNTNTRIINFWSAGIMDAVTANYDYYSANYITKSICLSGAFKDGDANLYQVRSKHYIANAEKITLRTGFAEYNINGGSSQWQGDMLYFDNNASLEYPTMGEGGKIRNLKGTYTLGKLANLTGDVSNRKWLSLFPWTTNRTLCMEVYSA